MTHAVAPTLLEDISRKFRAPARNKLETDTVQSDDGKLSYLRSSPPVTLRRTRVVAVGVSVKFLHFKWTGSGTAPLSRDLQ